MQSTQKISQHIQELKELGKIIKTVCLQCESEYAQQKIDFNAKDKTQMNELIQKTHSQVCGLVNDTTSVIYDIGRSLKGLVQHDVKRVEALTKEGRQLLLVSFICYLAVNFL